MLQNLKKWGIYALVGIIICGACFVSGYVVRWKQSPTISIDSGAIIEKTNIIYKPISSSGSGDCTDIIRQYNGLLNDYKFFLNAAPEVYEVTSENIKFKLASQRYQFNYSYTPRSKLSVSPFALARASFNPLGLYYGGGVAVEYIGITGVLAIDSQPAVMLGAGYRFTFDMK